MPSPRELLEPYLVERALHVAESTVAGDVFHLERFFEFLEEHGVIHVGQVTFERLDTYRALLETATGESGRPYSEPHLFAAVHKPCLFLRWAFRAGHTLVDFGEYPLPHRPTPNELEVPTPDQVRKLLEAPDPDSPSGRRDRLILESFYTLALRRRESHRLELSDVDLSRQTIRVVGKGRRERLLPLSDRLCGLFDDYFRKVRPALRPCPEENAVWVSPQSGNRLSFSYLRPIVWRNAEKVGLPRVYPHLLRHAAATHLLEAGAPLEQIQLFLGHLRPSSTQRYTHVTCRELQEVLQKCHPRAAMSEGEL